MAPPVPASRLQWMLETILEKVEAQGGYGPRAMNRVMEKYDVDGSGELDLDEFRCAMEEKLTGISDAEFEALFAHFDHDNSGTVSIAECLQTMKNLKAQLEASASQMPDSKARGDAGAASGAKATKTRWKPRAGGLGHRSTDEFVGHGEGIQVTKAERRDLLDMLQEHLLQLAEAHEDPDGTLHIKLLKRALDRHRSTKRARCLTRTQLRAALATVFFGDGEGEGDEDPDELQPLLEQPCEDLWLAADGGNMDSLIQKYTARAMPENTAEPALPLHARRLRDLLLDKIIARSVPGTSLRIAIKRLLSKYDYDESGDFSVDEFKHVVDVLLPGTNPKHADELIADFDQDGSGTLTINEVVGGLLKAQERRAETSTSLCLNRKKPLYSKAGARGL